MNFNSSMVRLRVSFVCELSVRLNHFNSSMVRLRECWCINHISSFIISIPVWYDWEGENSYKSMIAYIFQFQYGTIESWKVNLMWLYIMNFNSSMVRLRVNSIRCPGNIAATFQFQYGTIESIIITHERELANQFQFQYGTIERKPQAVLLLWYINFNSSMVRLRVKALSNPSSFIVISIPVWYDWECPSPYSLILFNQISIPVWYDWEPIPCRSRFS